MGIVALVFLDIVHFCDTFIFINKCKSIIIIIIDSKFASNHLLSGSLDECHQIYLICLFFIYFYLDSDIVRYHF